MMIKIAKVSKVLTYLTNQNQIAASVYSPGHDRGGGDGGYGYGHAGVHSVAVSVVAAADPVWETQKQRTASVASTGAPGPG